MDPSNELFSKEELDSFEYANNMRRDIADSLMSNGADKASDEELQVTLKALKDIDSNYMVRAKVRIAKDIQENTNKQSEIMASFLMSAMREKLGGGTSATIEINAPKELPEELELSSDEFLPGETTTGYQEISPDELVPEETEE